jgi:serine/threonine protein kinase
MPHQESIPTSTSDVLADLLLRWRELREQGRHSSIEELCAAHPELADALRQQVAALEAMEAVLGVGPNTETDPQAAAPEPAGNGSASPAELPGYEILGILNQGGMGIVYKARQLSLNRLVAVKMILSGAHAPPEQLARFRAEAEAVARLRHPNVVQIYEVGEHAGKPYFSMEFVEGGSLEQHLTCAVLPARQAAQLIESLAHAVHAAHQLGIIHRDLKPANILLAVASCQLPVVSKKDRVSSALTTDNWQLTTTPKITDFGLAKRLDQPAGTTRAGAVMGTPSYMAPEQAEGKNEAIGPGVDIYALGAVLYEALTGRPPFQGETTFDTLEQVRLREPVPPSRLQPRIPRDLETICLKCLEKDPHRRYANALSLAEDLHRFLAGEPILARPSSLWSHSIKWARRKPAVAALLAVSALAVVSLLGSWAWFTVELSRQMQRAQEGEQHAREQEALARTNQQIAEQQRSEAHRQAAAANASQQLAEQQRTAAEIGWRMANEQRRQAQQERERSDALLERCLAAIDEHARATTTAKGEMHQTGEPGRILYGLARFFAQTSATLRQDAALRPADREQLANQYAARAVTLLDSAAGAGFFGSTANLKQLRSDPGLDPLRVRPDFMKLLAKVDKKLDSKNR